jgi:hypothetical protein
VLGNKHLYDLEVKPADKGAGESIKVTVHKIVANYSYSYSYPYSYSCYKNNNNNNNNQSIKYRSRWTRPALIRWPNSGR